METVSKHGRNQRQVDLTIPQTSNTTGDQAPPFPDTRRSPSMRSRLFMNNRGWVGSAVLLGTLDRKSTRLNSSHGYISYAVFCLKKKIRQPTSPATTQGRAKITPCH